MHPRPSAQVGWLEILCSAAAVCLVVGRLFDLWPLHLPIALLVLGALYAALRDVRSLNAVKRRVPAQPIIRNAHGKQTMRAPR